MLVTVHSQGYPALAPPPPACQPPQTGDDNDEEHRSHHLPLAVATSNNGTHITNGGYNYSLTLEWVNDSNTSVSLIIPNVTLAHAGYYTCNVTLRNCSVASGVHCNYSAGEEDDQYHANRTLTQRMHLTVIPATTIAPTTLVSHTTSTSHRPHRRPVSKRPTHKPVTLGPFPIDPWRPKTTWVHWALLLITCAVVAPVLLIIIISCLGWLAGWGLGTLQVRFTLAPAWAVTFSNLTRSEKNAQTDPTQQHNRSTK